ncbi:O-antigen ligase family protein [Tautonia marina]|uniref:O-antigen ligase family protein n=1 Tax=Tautonia marina TaxID=2653855 RepID=UPI0013754AEA|nr:O-antigen ligase family protein [Tautonia marina]
MIATILAWLGSGRFQWKSSGLSVAYFLFAVSMIMCWVLSPWSSSVSSQTLIENYLKVLIFFVILITTIQSERELKLILLGFLGVNALYMLHSFREYLSGRHVYRMGMARMIGVDTSLGDPNSFAASVMYALPLVTLIGAIIPGRKGRLLTVGYVGLSMACIFLSGSRSALVGLIIWATMMSLNVKRKLRWIVLIAVLGPLCWSLLPPDHQTRFYTLIDPSVGPANAQESAESRGEGFRLGQKLFAEYPLTGCGPGAWIPATGSPVESHNLYGQVMGEMGLIGVMTFSTIVFLMTSHVLSIRSLRRRTLPCTSNDFLRSLAVAIGQALILLLVLGWGGHNLFRFTWLWYGAFLIVAKDMALKQAEASAFQDWDSHCEWNGVDGDQPDSNSWGTR